jgi:hypothetical protein
LISQHASVEDPHMTDTPATQNSSRSTTRATTRAAVRLAGGIS